MNCTYCIPKLSQLNDYFLFSQKYNAYFEYNDFFIPSVMDDARRTDEIISIYKSLDRDRSNDTLHGAFLDICINSDDPMIYNVSDYRVRQSLDIAMRLGVRAVVFHTNHIANFKLKSYQDNWTARNEKYWRQVLKEYTKLNIYIENMFDQDDQLLKKLAIKMSDEPRFGVCLDIAHAFIGTQPLSEWFNDLAPYIRHLHINDNNGIEDLHKPVGSMNVPWNMYSDYINSVPATKRPSVLLEVNCYDDLIASVRYMEKNGLYPFS